MNALLWNLINAESWTTGNIFTENLEPDDQVFIKFSPNGMFLILATDESLALMDIVSGQLVRPIESSYGASLPAFRRPFLEEYADLETDEDPIRMWAEAAQECLH